MTIIQDTPSAELCSYNQEKPNGTVYFSNGSFFQYFSVFQQQPFQESVQHAHFPNVSHTQEHSFSSFQEPAPQQNLL